MNTVNIENIDLGNLEFQNAWNLIRNTHRSVFLTGKAGTGKSTFLKYICANTTKKHVVLAPTGIAAVNVGGQTLHSFFKIPFKPLLPDDPDFSPRRIRKTLRYSSQKVKLIRTLDLIIIDEISMVRCDMVDFIDKVLRIYSGNMREPFGGKQLLFVGDIFQLEPVITRDMRDILRRYYEQFFFFNARVFNRLGLIPIELRKIYRQTDSNFISMLDRVRVSHASNNDLLLLNGRCEPDYKEVDDKFVMTLATRRDTVDSINDAHMRALDTPEYVFEGEVTDVFPDNDLPTSKELTLKRGAQVIFIRNDREGRWVNGSLGKVSRLDSNSIEVELENGESYSLEQEIWENVQYSYDEKEKKVIENVVGTFKQYPIKPAWALTVHKSQGFAQAMEIHSVINNDSVAKRFIKIKFNKFHRLNTKIKNLEEVIDSQNKQLLELASEFTAMGDQALGLGTLAQEDEVPYGNSNTKLDEIAVKSALANYNKALRISKGYVPAMLGKARLMEAIGESDKAIVQLEMVLEKNKNCYDALMMLASIYEKDKDISAAVKLYKRASRASRIAIEPILALARVYDKIGLDDVADEYRDVVKQMHKQQQAKKSRRKKK